MPWIEYFLHIDPDHGSGSLEALIALCLVALLAFALVRVRRRV